MDKPYTQLLKERSDRDFVERTRSGVLIYVAGYPLLIFSTEVYRTYPRFCMIMFALIVAVGGVRFVLEYLYHTAFYRNHQSLWRAMLLVMALGHSLCWSVIFGKFLADPTLFNVSFSMLLALIAIVSGSTNTLIPKGGFFHLYVLIMMVPTIAILVIAQFHISILLAMLFYWVYSFFLGRQIYTEYVRSFNSEYEAGKSKEALEALSKTDSLTGIFNRHHFNESIEQQWRICMRNQYPLSLIMLDVDHFKLINDTYGHILGDECLVHIGTLLKREVKRSSDIVTRYGGEEFAIILPNTSMENAVDVAEHIRQAVEDTPFQLDDMTLSVTASFGVSSMIPSQRLTVLELLANADAALYTAKNAGRNRVEAAQ